LTIDYEPVNVYRVSLQILAPSVTDYTIGSAPLVAYDQASGKSQFNWTATGKGGWILQLSCDCSTILGYRLTAHVRRGHFIQKAGMKSIAGAPILPIGRPLVSGAQTDKPTTGEFWRVPLVAGDRLTINYQPVNVGRVSLEILRPTVTDYTLANAGSVAYDQASGKSTFSWTATRTGRWLLEVSCDCSSVLGYQLTAYVKHKPKPKR
jgi:hypothetical protein